ncbi:MAG TPA: succinate dehydrogenase assembly factor 2 [Alphaproteobacteria bacterium]|nr:succinate dehydrogenase assembly factor 2 [Alphaproteobacteria bacterium]
MKKNLKKRLWYKCSHRGTKENDLLLLKLKEPLFFQFDDHELEVLDEFLDLSDQQIFSYCMKDPVVPKKYEFILEHIIYE